MYSDAMLSHAYKHFKDIISILVDQLFSVIDIVYDFVYLQVLDVGCSSGVPVFNSAE